MIATQKDRTAYSLAEDLSTIARSVGVRFELTGWYGRSGVRFRILPDAAAEGSRDIGKGRTAARYQRASIGDVMRGVDPARRVTAVCWHGHYAFMSAAFRSLHGLRIRSSFADYRSPRDFADAAYETGLRNVGNAYHEVQYREACYCGEDGEAIEQAARFALTAEDVRVRADQGRPY